MFDLSAHVHWLVHDQKVRLSATELANLYREALQVEADHLEWLANDLRQGVGYPTDFDRNIEALRCDKDAALCRILAASCGP